MASWPDQTVQVLLDRLTDLRAMWSEEHQIALELEAKLQFMTERCKALESDNRQKDWALDQEFACGDEPEPMMIKLWVDA